MSAPTPALHEISVSDHAVVRWLERACGVDLEAFREAMRQACLAGGLADLPADASAWIDVPGHRVHLLVRHAEIITVFHYDREAD